MPVRVIIHMGIGCAVYTPVAFAVGWMGGAASIGQAILSAILHLGVAFGILSVSVYLVLVCHNLFSSCFKEMYLDLLFPDMPDPENLFPPEELSSYKMIILKNNDLYKMM